MSVANPYLEAALDILRRQPGRAADRSNCAAVQRAIELLAASSDEDSACLVLLAIVMTPALAEAICLAAGAPTTPIPAADRPTRDTLPEVARRFAGSASEPAGDRSLIDLHIELARAREVLADADAIDHGPRWAREMEAASANVRRIEAEIAETERRLAK